MKKLLLIFLVLLTPRAFALKEYYSISRSIRALGMGGAFYGLSNDESALFYNPAGLSHYPYGSQGMFSIQGQVAPNFSDAIKTITDSEGKGIDQIVLGLQQFQGKPLTAGASFMPYYLRKHFALALLAPDVKVNVAVLGRDFDTQVDIAGVGDAGLLLGYGNTFFDPNLSLGITVKGLYRVGGSKTFTTLDILNQAAADLDLKALGGGGAGVDFDLGATYELPFKPFNSTIRTSLVLNNALASQFTIARLTGGAAPPALTRMLTLAGLWRLPGWKAFEHFDVLVDFSEFQIGGESDPSKGSRTGSFFKHLNWGVEAPFLNQFFALRAGFRQGYFSAGFGITTRFLKLDLATYAEELLSNPGQLGARRFALRLAFGFGAAAPSVEPQVEPTQPEPEKKDEPAPVKEEPKVEEKKLDPAAVVPPPPAEKPVVKPEPTPDAAKRKPQSETKLSPKDKNDRFDVDSLVEEYPKSYNP
jgi:hypothetical protein